MKLRDALVLTVAALFTSMELPRVGHQSVSGLAAEVANVPGAIVEASVNIASNVSDGHHLGFDTNKYPGVDAMTAWKESGPYEWVGYYLPAPCHKDESWSGQRESLVNMGWGLAVVYVGQQTWGRTPNKNARVAAGTTCSAHFVDAEHGELEADDAIATATAEGFPRGTVIFLDIERMDLIPPAMRDYYKAWTARVLADGTYRPGIYTHTHNADVIYRDVKATFLAAGVNEEPPFWVAGATSEFASHKIPTDVGHAFAAVWQGVLDKFETRNGVRLPIDVNVASVPSPSYTGVTLGD